VRKDFGVQNVKNMDAVRSHEWIARFHILSLHEMCELDEEKFSEQQENEQLRKGRTFEHSFTPRWQLMESLNLSPFFISFGQFGTILRRLEQSRYLQRQRSRI
jgi:SAC3/GANP family